MTSSLSNLNMALEAGPLIHQRYDGIGLAEYIPLLANGTFFFDGSDGVSLQVRHLLPADWKPVNGPLAVLFDSVPHTIIGTHFSIRNHPIYKLNDGSILVVFDPAAKHGFEFTNQSFVDPQLEVSGENRFLRLVTNDQDFAYHGSSLSMIHDKGVKRPANAFILFRTDKMKPLKAQYPEMGNNDISKILGRMWQNSSDEVKDVYKARAHQLAVSHKLTNPDYKYSPRRSREIMRRDSGNKGPSPRIDLHRAGVAKREKKRIITHLGFLTQRFATHPTANNLGDIIEEAEKVLKAFGMVN
uniref:MAT1-2-1 n=1 Tax=Tuber indicum TaxID=55307 RepID=W0C6E9_9PEZI|nr:MAT1-2-1 [Tuber indicum]